MDIFARLDRNRPPPSAIKELTRLEKLADIANSAHGDVDPWEHDLAVMPSKVVHRSGDGFERVASAEVLEQLLSTPLAQQTTAHGQRLGRVMKKLGWGRNRAGLVTINGVQRRGYIRRVAAATVTGARAIAEAQQANLSLED